MVLPSVARAQVPGFHPTGYAPNTLGSKAYGLSANGRVATGFSIGSDIVPGFSWTAEGGRVDFGLEVGLPVQTIADAISGDGSTVVGGTANRAFSYRGPGTYQEIAPVGGYTATAASGVSGDGGVVAGRLYFPQSLIYQAFRWTQAGGVQPLGVARPGTDASSAAAAISRDGSTIVGISGEGIAPSVAFAWHQGSGMLALPSLPGGGSSEAWSVNFDGSIIVGQSGPNGDAAMWRDGQVFNLGVPQGWFGGEAFAVNDTGAVVVGHTFGGGATQAATIWTPSSGMELLSTYLTRNGVVVPSDWTLLQATAVSANGLTIAGWGRNSLTGGEGFVVTIPAPSSLAILGLGSLAFRRRRSPRRRSCP